MLMRNSINDLKRVVLDNFGMVLWGNQFESWTKKKEEEAILYWNGFIIYAQTEFAYLQPCWVVFEHNFNAEMKTIRLFVEKCFIKSEKDCSHTSFQVYPKKMFELLNTIQKKVEVHQIFRDIPDYRAFHLLNKMEVLKNLDERQRFKIILEKMRKAHLDQFVPIVKFVPNPEHYNI